MADAPIATRWARLLTDDQRDLVNVARRSPAPHEKSGTTSGAVTDESIGGGSSRYGRTRFSEPDATIHDRHR
jgi:hypothetical protein